MFFAQKRFFFFLFFFKANVFINHSRTYVKEIILPGILEMLENEI